MRIRFVKQKQIGVRDIYADDKRVGEAVRHRRLKNGAPRPYWHGILLDGSEFFEDSLEKLRKMLGAHHA